MLSYERLLEVSPGDPQALYGRCAVCVAMKDRPALIPLLGLFLLEVKDARAPFSCGGAC